MIGEPTSPNDNHARMFYKSDEWRAAAEDWDVLATGAEVDGDDRIAKYCAENAMQCRHNARVRELSEEREKRTQGENTP